MPGALPPTSDYTYAVDFFIHQVVEKENGIDVKFFDASGASQVLFWEENFVGFQWILACLLGTLMMFEILGSRYLMAISSKLSTFRTVGRLKPGGCRGFGLGITAESSRWWHNC